MDGWFIFCEHGAAPPRAHGRTKTTKQLQRSGSFCRGTKRNRKPNRPRLSGYGAARRVHKEQKQSAEIYCCGILDERRKTVYSYVVVSSRERTQKSTLSFVVCEHGARLRVHYMEKQQQKLPILWPILWRRKCRKCALVLVRPSFVRSYCLCGHGALRRDHKDIRSSQRIYGYCVENLGHFCWILWGTKQ